MDLGQFIIGEIVDISRFETAPQLVAYAGLDVAAKQSGEFAGTQTKMISISKKSNMACSNSSLLKILHYLNIL